MENPNHLALIVARRQKRLQYWQKRLAGDEIDTERTHEITEQLSTYALLLSKLAKAENAAPTQDAEDRLQALERELAALFEARRLMTSDIGSSITGGYPER